MSQVICENCCTHIDSRSAHLCGECYHYLCDACAREGECPCLEDL